MREDSITETSSQRAILTTTATAPTTTALAFVFERNTIRRRPKRIASTSQPTSIGAGAYVEHAFTVKVTRRRYVTCPVMAHASRDAGLYFVLSANLRPRWWARYFHRLCWSPGDADGFSKDSRLSPPSSPFHSYRQYAVLGADPVLVDFIIRKSPGLQSGRCPRFGDDTRDDTRHLI